MGNRSKFIIFMLSAVFLWVTVSFNACSKAEFSQDEDLNTKNFCEENPEDSSCILQGRNKTNIIDVNEGGQVDVLFVVDNSVTMDFEHRSTAARVGSFLNNVQNLDWQIAVTTTNVSDIDAPGVDGRFVPLVGASGLILNKNTANAQTVLGRTIQEGTMSSAVRIGNGLNYEQGLFAAYRTIERYQANQTEQKSFFRTGAQLAIVLISDEEEAMYMMGGPHEGTSGFHSEMNHKNSAEDLQAIVVSTFNGRKNLVFHSMIALTSSCLRDEGVSLGLEYEKLSIMTDGIIGSVCSSDYGGVLSDIGTSVTQKRREIALECIPESGTLNIEFQTVGTSGYVEFQQSYNLNQAIVEFSNDLALGKYKLTYVCPPQ